MDDPTDTPVAYAKLFAWLDRHRVEAEAELDVLAARIPAFAPLLAAMPVEVRKTQSERSRELQRQALVDGDWGPLYADLRTQAQMYAQMGIEFADWYVLLGTVRAPLVKRLPPDRDEAIELLEAMNAYLDRVMSTLGDTYVRAKQELLVRAEQKLARHVRELERSNRELDEFAYVASHDLKSPLQDIRSLAGWIAEDLGERTPPDAARYLGLLGDRAARMERLLDDLLDYSRVGRMHGTPQEFAARDVVADVAALVAPPEGFTVVYEGDSPRLRTPLAPFEKVLRNLVANAIKHHDRGEGQVIVRAAPEGPGWVRVGVTDDGPGIPPAFHERVFRMFQTLKPRDEVEGSGVGLAIVKKTVDWFGGRVGIESPSRGTTVWFTWPTVWEGGRGSA